MAQEEKKNRRGETMDKNTLYATALLVSIPGAATVVRYFGQLIVTQYSQH